MLSVLLTDLAHWRYLLTADRLLLLQIIFTFGKVHRSNCPTADWHQHETASKVNTFWRFQNPSQKGTLLQNIIWSKSPSLYVMIDKYRSCLVIIMHLRGKYFGVLLTLLEFLATLIMAAYYWDFPLTALHCFWPCVGPLFVFCIFFRYEWVFAGICFWYFPLPAGALDLRPWPFCRPGRKLTGPGTDPGTMQTTWNSALLYCFCPYSFFIVIFFV